MRGRASFRNRFTAGTSTGAGSPLLMRAVEPSAKTQSSAVTHRRVDPNSSECAPAAFVAAIPPTVQNSPLDGSTGNLKPCLAAAELTADRRAPGPVLMRRATASTGPIVFI